MKAPYEQFTDARSGQGMFTFLTGEGGFPQEFVYGYTGLRCARTGCGSTRCRPSSPAGCA